MRMQNATLVFSVFIGVGFVVEVATQAKSLEFVDKSIGVPTSSTDGKNQIRRKRSDSSDSSNESSSESSSANKSKSKSGRRKGKKNRSSLSSSGSYEYESSSESSSEEGESDKNKGESSSGTHFEEGPLESENEISCNCGQPRKAKVQNRIIGGSETAKYEYPWLVRIYGGCVKMFCTGSLISDRHVITAYHCLRRKGEKPCDHSDGERMAVIGAHFLDPRTKKTDGRKIPLKEYRFPKYAEFKPGDGDPRTHDMAIYVLSEPVKFTRNIYPICLPKIERDYKGEMGIAAGWGDYRVGDHSNSDVLRHVQLEVYKKMKKHDKMFTTLVKKNKDGLYQDPCKGDSGGPLMWTNKDARKVIIGTVNGGGYDCDKNKLAKGKKQRWNSVSSHLDWIKKVLNEDKDTPMCAYDY